MFFQSIQFLFGFLPIVILGYFLTARWIGSRGAISWLVIVSAIFYAWWSPYYLLLLTLSIGVNYAIGGAIIRSHKAGKTRSLRWFVTAGIVFDIALLAYFKYTNFFIGTINSGLDLSLAQRQILLPIGISFYTFQQIAYLVDLYRKPEDAPDFLHYCFLVSFFPKLLTGPLVRHGEFLTQLRNPDIYRFRSKAFIAGFTILMLGLAKKLLIADELDVFVSWGFNMIGGGQPLTFLEAWATALSYTLQIYFDFSAYSDMAIGIAAMMGIDVPVNFRSPYLSTGAIEFWRRWHITLSNFLRDYIYIPFGGNRKGKVRRYVNLMATMLIGGLWHGAAWTFVVWGGLHGLFLMINHGWRSVKKARGWASDFGGRAGAFAGWAVTMVGVIAAWVIFRSPDFDSALQILKGMAGLEGIVLPARIVNAVPVLGLIVQGIQDFRFLDQGTMLLLVEMLSFLALGTLVALGTPNIYKMSERGRLCVLILTGALTLQKIFFEKHMTEFVYFQF